MISFPLLSLYFLRLDILTLQFMMFPSSTLLLLAIVKASDGAEIEVTLPPGETFESKYVQILGKIMFDSFTSS